MELPQAAPVNYRQNRTIMNLLEAISLDVVPSPPPFLDFPLAQQKSFRQGKTILLAEDDDDLRYVMECTLTAMGYLVLPCANAQLAISAFHSQSVVDILLTDFEMPGKSGVELARELTGICPPLPVVVITGSTLSPEILQEMQDKHWIYISKPCRLPHLEATLANILTPERALTAKLKELAA